MKRIFAIASACALAGLLGGCVTAKQACKYRPIAAVGVNLLGTQVDIGPEVRSGLSAGADILCNDPAGKPAKKAR